MKKRTSGLEIPDVDEILEIVFEKESQRTAAHPEWPIGNKAIFEPFRELCLALGAEDIYAELGKMILSKEDMADVVASQERVKAYIIERLLTQHSVDRGLLRRVYEALAQEDDLSAADAIFVFGAPSNARIDKAIELHKDGYAPRIIISGKGPNWAGSVDLSEAQRMADYAIAEGVAEHSIIVEPLAPTIPDNVKRTLDVFDNMNWHPGKLIIVSTSFVLLRSYVDWKKFSPQDIDLIRVAPQLIDENKGPDLWHTNTDGLHAVINEYAKIFGESCVDSFIAHNSAYKNHTD